MRAGKARRRRDALHLRRQHGTSAQAVGEPLHLLVGRSMFVNTENRIKRVYVSNPDVLDSFTSSPHQIVITSKAPGLSSLVSGMKPDNPAPISSIPTSMF